MNWKRFSFYFYNFYPPFLGAGIRIRKIAPDFSRVDVSMGLHFWNKNLVGTQFGGSLYAMTDPFFMTILLMQLGSGYVVWDKAAEIRFKRPGRGKVRATFEIAPEEVARIRKVLEVEPKTEPRYTVRILDEGGEVVAEVDKLLYVRRKDRDIRRPGRVPDSRPN